jgi:hypothetical protein
MMTHTSTLRLSLALALATLLNSGNPGISQPLQPNTLTPGEKAAGWQLLFDGKTTEGWRSFKKDSFPKQGWAVEDGWLAKLDGIQGGDIISMKTFSEFEFSWEWKISPKGNNGIKYFITESRGGAIGHEYQMMDDPDQTGKHSTASFYDVLAPAADKPMKPAGEINYSRIVVRGDFVEHWLNGKKVLEYQLGSASVQDAVSKSKFKNVQGFGTRLEGHILLTDHKDGAWFRNLKIRPRP